jgi:hypothetical protein
MARLHWGRQIGAGLYLGLFAFPGGHLPAPGFGSRPGGLVHSGSAVR